MPSQTTEWTAILRGADGRWRPVGTVGGKSHAEAEAEAWRLEMNLGRRALNGQAVDVDIALAFREVGPWVPLPPC